MSRAARPCEAVVFDLGGVVFNWSPPDLILARWPHLAQTRAQAQALAQSIFQSFVPGSDWTEFDRGTLQRPELERRLSQRTGLAEQDLHQLVDAIPGHLAPLADTVDWIERLARSGTRLHFLSNMPRPFADHLVRQHAVFQRFSSGVFSCDVRQIKPEAAIFQTAADRFGIDPGRCVFIDDHAGNVAVAQQLGWQAVQFVDAAQCERTLVELGALPSSPSSMRG